MGKNHLFLKNEFGTCRIFKRSRGRNDEKESSDEVKNYHVQKERIRSCSEAFYRALSYRHSRRDPHLHVEHFDLISIDLLKVADKELINKLEKVYGLSPVSYTNMNQSVLFAIADENRFKEVFISHIKRFCEEQNDAYTNDKVLTLINGFKYWGSDSIKAPTVPNENARDLLLELTDLNPRMATKQRSVKEAMVEYLESRHVRFSSLSEGIYQIDSINNEQLTFLLDNYDVIQRVQALHTIRIRPNTFGDTVRETDASLSLNPNAPTIGVIDTGVHKLPVLTPVLAHDGIDLVDPSNPKPYEINLLSDSSHGTTIATLASFGNAFYHNIDANQIEADAKIFSIKVQRGETGSVNIAGIISAIYEANQKYDIRIFNLSMSVRCKNYNQEISTYAYLLDELAYALDVLIFISVGNLDEADIENIVNMGNRETTSERVRKFLSYPNHYYNPAISLEETECHECECMNLCEPSESMNNMSVGAIAENFNPNHTTHLSLGKEYPAYYSRKYHIDYNMPINGTRFKNNQKNKNLFKPDIVMPGGDQLETASKMLVLAPRADGQHLRIIQNSGTSYASPLAANIAAKILCRYPSLNMQSVKALIINSAKSIDPHYLHDTIESLKKQEDSQYPHIDRKGKTELSKKYSEERLSKYLSGHGVPDITKCLDSDDHRCTFIIEDMITYDSHKVINLNIPEYLLQYTKKDSVLTLTATLCYKFKPVRSNVLSYCPIHISFKFGNSMNHDDATANANEYAQTWASENKERMAIKADVETWSDDFYPVSSKMFCNVQKKCLNLTRNDIEKVGNQVAIVFRCTGRDEWVGSSHNFSFVLTMEQKESTDLEGHSLYDELELTNAVQVIAETHLEAEA